MIIVVVHALMSWFPDMRGRPFELWLRMLVEPAEKPIRQFLQPIQANIGIDFSPAVFAHCPVPAPGVPLIGAAK